MKIILCVDSEMQSQCSQLNICIFYSFHITTNYFPVDNTEPRHLWFVKWGGE